MLRSRASRLVLVRSPSRNLSCTLRRCEDIKKPNTDPPTPANGSEDVAAKLRGYSERSLIDLRRRTDLLTDRVKNEFSNLGAYLNNVTGYAEVEGLKRLVAEQENRITTARKAARDAKAAYTEAVTTRSNSQRQLHDLLQRKDTWTEQDVLTFTTLVKSDHASNIAETNTKKAMEEAEETVEKEFNSLIQIILARYHEEQVWSDKIRSASTYGSLVVMGLNLLVFITAIVIVEPWKRRRLAGTFEKKVDELELAVKADLAQVIGALDSQSKAMELLVVENKQRLSEIGGIAEGTVSPLPQFSWRDKLANIPHVPPEYLAGSGAVIASTLLYILLQR